MKGGIFYIGLCFILAVSGCGSDESDEPSAQFIRSEPSDGQTIIFEDSVSPQLRLDLFFDNPLYAVAVNGIFAPISENRATWTGWSGEYDPVSKKMRLSVVWWDKNGTLGGRATINLHVRYTGSVEKLINGNWRLQSLGSIGEEILLIPHTEITLRFREGGLLEGFSGCNWNFSIYEAKKDGTLNIKRPGSTKRLCGIPDGDIMGQEEHYVDALSKVTAFEIEQIHLRLFDENKKKVLNFIDVKLAIEPESNSQRPGENHESQ